MTYSNYKVYPDGRVWDTLREKYNTHYDRGGYKFVSLKDDDGVWRTEYVHRLVGTTYLPNPDNLPVILHLDDNPSNNDVSNLRWGTQSDNVKMCFDRDRHPKTKPTKLYKLLSPEGELVETTNLKLFCQERGLSPSSMGSMYRGYENRTQHRGWRKYPD